MRGSLLVVDDDPEICALLNRALSGEFSVDCAQTGQEAFCKLQLRRYTLALVDLALPDTSGLEVAAEAASRGSAVVMMSGHDVEARLADQPYVAVQKPFRMHNIIAVLREAMAFCPRAS